MDDFERLVRYGKLSPLVLSAPGLFYKFGFRDGDMVQYWANEITDANSVDVRDALRRSLGVGSQLWSPNWHGALWELILIHLLSEIPGKLDLELWVNDTLHNPVRIHTWNEREFSGDEDVPSELKEISVTVDGWNVLDTLKRVSSEGYVPPESSAHSRITW